MLNSIHLQAPVGSLASHAPGVMVVPWPVESPAFPAHEICVCPRTVAHSCPATQWEADAASGFFAALTHDSRLCGPEPKVGLVLAQITSRTQWLTGERLLLSQEQPGRTGRVVLCLAVASLCPCQALGVVQLPVVGIGAREVRSAG